MTPENDIKGQFTDGSPEESVIKNDITGDSSPERSVTESEKAALKAIRESGNYPCAWLPAEYKVPEEYDSDGNLLSMRGCGH